MRLRARLERLVKASMALEEPVPMLIIDEDGSSRAAGEPMTWEEWEARYGEQAERERASGREIFGIDFRLDYDEPEIENQAAGPGDPSG